MVKATENGAIASDPFAILSAADSSTEDVYVPEWSTTIRVRSISAAEREDLLRSSVTIDGKVRKVETPLMRVKIVWLSAVKEDGVRLFTTQQQLTTLGSKSAAAIDRVADVAMRLAAITDDTEDDAGKAPSSSPTSDSVTT